MNFFKKRKKLCIILLLAAVILITCDMRLKNVYYTIESEKVSQPVRLVLITDLHSDKYGKNQSTLIKAVEKQNPDVVLLGGDIFDDAKAYTNAEIALKQLAEKYSCYYVTGNHEYWSHDVGTILDYVKSCGITVLSGECVPVEINGQIINICGVDDPDVEEFMLEYDSFEEQLKTADEAASNEYFTVLLSHRPELVDTYELYDFDLVLSGHAHGGQWRIPYLVNGLYVPNQGLFPKYAGGRYDFDDWTLIISRGLARESTPIPRIFNRPELVVVDIK